jgi:threonine synthase
VPASASGPKRTQIERYGAQLTPVPGPRSAAAEAVLGEVEKGAVYASHAYLPFGLPGIATIAYELWEELGAAPGSVVTPVGQGSLLLGIRRGFAALHQEGLIPQMPYLVGVQARACPPVWTGFTKGKEAIQQVEEGPTVAEGIRVRHPVWADALLNEIAPQSGTFVAVEEEKILPAYHDLARRGVYVEPTSAVVWSALEQMIGKAPEPIILVVTGSGLKYQSV